MIPYAMIVASCLSQPASLPELIVDRDNYIIDQSAKIVIPQNVIIEDKDKNGVLQISGDDIVVEFAEGSVLRGASEDKPWDKLEGTGIRLINATNVTIRGAQVHGFHAGIYATKADGLTVEQANLSDNWRRRLLSTPEAEDSSDWMSPHYNDQNEWLSRYGAALYIEDSDRVTVREVLVRRGQNGILLDRVNSSRIYDNDASFLSGWGLALWRSSDNVITRNAFDFCIRGHVEGVYNRGQDSAGILFFEQCNRNIVAENSATHGGDGFFGFGGREALGQAIPEDPEWDHTRKGCNDNLFIHNDLSYAPAHGFEMTFSFGNKVLKNRMVENAICGIWGGFSQETLIAGNLFDGNGGMPYGLERGAINIEHGSKNTVVDNDFINNRAGIHYWWDHPGDIPDLPWGQANYRGVDENTIAGNRFIIDRSPRPFVRFGDQERRLAYHFREDESGKISNLKIFANTYEFDGPLAKRMSKAETIQIDDETPESGQPEWETPEYPLFGKSRPVIIRDGIPYSSRDESLRGRDKIIMDAWGPWDHESPLVRLQRKRAGEVVYDVFGTGDQAEIKVEGAGVHSTITGSGPVKQVKITAGPGVTPYTLTVKDPDLKFDHVTDGSLLSIRWSGRVFSWKGKEDPRDDFEGWKQLARVRGSVPVALDTVDLAFGFGGPKEMVREGRLRGTVNDGKLILESDIGSDYFGTEIVGRMPLEPGNYRVRTVSDDGIRVYYSTGNEMGWQPLIERWDQHGPTPDEGTFIVKERDIYALRILHFEIDGYAMLSVDVERTGD